MQKFIKRNTLSIILQITFIVLYNKQSLAFFARDKELYESTKCTRVFSYFEKKYKIPKDALHAIALQESGKKHSKHNIRITWPWTVNIESQGYYFDNKKDAVAFARSKIREGKTSIDVGCMQINLKNHPRAFETLEQAFEPLYNIQYAAEFLRLKYDKVGDWVKAVGHYHSENDQFGIKYRNNVLKIAENMQNYKKSLTQALNKRSSQDNPKVALYTGNKGTQSPNTTKSKDAISSNKNNVASKYAAKYGLNSDALRQ